MHNKCGSGVVPLTNCEGSPLTKCDSVVTCDELVTALADLGESTLVMEDGLLKFISNKGATTTTPITSITSTDGTITVTPSVDPQGFPVFDVSAGESTLVMEDGLLKFVSGNGTTTTTPITSITSTDGSITVTPSVSPQGFPVFNVSAGASSLVLEDGLLKFTSNDGSTTTTPITSITSTDGTITVTQSVDPQGFPVFNISSPVVDINVDNFSYDDATKTITLTETDGEAHSIDVSDLVDTVLVDGTSIEFNANGELTVTPTMLCEQIQALTDDNESLGSSHSIVVKDDTGACKVVRRLEDCLPIGTKTLASAIFGTLEVPMLDVNDPSFVRTFTSANGQSFNEFEAFPTEIVLSVADYPCLAEAGHDISVTVSGNIGYYMDAAWARPNNAAVNDNPNYDNDPEGCILEVSPYQWALKTRVNDDQVVAVNSDRYAMNLSGYNAEGGDQHQFEMTTTGNDISIVVYLNVLGLLSDTVPQTPWASAGDTLNIDMASITATFLPVGD